ncbi:MAG TPA: hypothetical protein VK632_02420, partial [Verrucomicrobiae bacterium]|nr:hypothetical protein [Verrucomicrobiae bacterium]
LTPRHNELNDYTSSCCEEATHKGAQDGSLCLRAKPTGYVYYPHNAIHRVPNIMANKANKTQDAGSRLES